LPHLPDHEKEIQDKGAVPENEFRWWLKQENVHYVICKTNTDKAGCFIEYTKNRFEVMYLYKEAGIGIQ
jgi:hypothetical protein